MDWSDLLLSLAAFVLIVATVQRMIVLAPRHRKLMADHRKLTAWPQWPTPGPRPNKNPEPIIELPGHLKGTGLGTAATARKSAHAVAEPEPMMYGKIFTVGSGLIPNPMWRSAIGLDQGEAGRWYPALQPEITFQGDGTHEKVYHIA